MGVWGYKAYDNDTAADWFGNVLEKIELVKYVEIGLQSDRIEIRRAAAFLVVQLGINYVYPIDFLDKHLELAKEVLVDILADHDWVSSWENSQEVIQELKADIKELKSRLPKAVAKK